jgi:hypothetical protein
MRYRKYYVNYIFLHNTEIKALVLSKIGGDATLQLADMPQFAKTVPGTWSH